MVSLGKGERRKGRKSRSIKKERVKEREGENTLGRWSGKVKTLR